MIRAFFVTASGKTFSKDFDSFDDFMRFKRSAREVGTKLQGFCSIDE